MTIERSLQSVLETSFVPDKRELRIQLNAHANLHNTFFNELLGE